jgi:ABC-2 type transport system ATP-binding protein
VRSPPSTAWICRLAAGRIYGLLGPNGSGKTTLIRLLSGLGKPTSGEARVLGVKMPSRAVLERIGYMTQSDGIYTELSVWENLRFFATLYGKPTKHVSTRCWSSSPCLTGARR